MATIKNCIMKILFSIRCRCDVKKSINEATSIFNIILKSKEKFCPNYSYAVICFNDYNMLFTCTLQFRRRLSFKA